MSQINRLCTRSVEFEATATPEGDGRTLEGYGAVFNSPTRINNWEGDFQETIAPGAFKKTLSERKPIMQYDHGRDPRVGSLPIGAIQELREDEQGLYVRARMLDNPIVEPIRQAIEAGAISGMSFKFNVVRDEWRDATGRTLRPEELGRLLHNAGERGPLQRHIKEVQLFEVGPVATPAYSGTSVGVRSLTDEEREALIDEYRKTMEVPEERHTPECEGMTEPSADCNMPHLHTEMRGEHGPETVQMRASLPMGTKEEVQHSWVKLHHDQAFRKSISLDEWHSLESKLRAAAEKFDIKLHKNPLPASWKKFNDGKFVKSMDQWDEEMRGEFERAMTSASMPGGPASSDNDADDNRPHNYANGVCATCGSEDSDPDAACDPSKLTIGNNAYKAPHPRSSEDTGAAPKGTPATSRDNDDAAPKGTSSERESTNTTRKAVTPMAKTLEELRARLDEISERMQELGGGEEAETRSLDDEAQTEFDALDTEFTETERAIEQIEKRAERLRTLAGRAGSTERGSDRSPAFHKKAEDIYDVEEIRSLSYGGEDFQRKLRDNAMRAIEAAKFGVRDDAEAREQAELTLDEAIDNSDGTLEKRYLLTGSPVYERAFTKVLRYGSDALCTPEERAALVRSQLLGTDSSGGYAVPFQLDPTVMLTNAGATNPIRNLARVERIVGKQWQGVTSAGVTVTRGSETTTVGDNSFSLGQPTVSTNRVQGFVPFTIEIDLAWNALRSEITRVLVDAKAREEDSFITGDGTGTNPEGILTGASTTVTAGGTASFAASDVYALHAAIPPRFEDRATFLAHKGIYNKVRQFDTSGGAQLWAHIGDGRPNGLMGYPAAYASAMPSTLTTGNKIMVLGDFSNFLIVDRVGMTVELVPHLFDSSNGNRPSGQRGVYAIWMNNSKTLIPGAFRTLVTG